MRYKTTKTFVTLAFFLAILFLTPNAFATMTANDVKQTLENVYNADAVRYDTKDNTSRNVETLDVIYNPGSTVYQNDRYIGVSHILENGEFQVYLTQSSDLMSWTNLIKLKSNASNPAIKAVDGGFLVALESHDSPGNHIQMRFYENLSDLKNNLPSDTFDGTRHLSQYAEGTPSFRSVSWGTNFDDSNISLGMHYYKDGDVDRQAIANLNNGVWSQEVRTGFNSLFNETVETIMSLVTSNTIGNFGSRREFAIDGKAYELVEGQLTKNDWASWRLFLYDVEEDQLIPLSMNAHYGQTSFGNGSTHVLPNPNGNGNVLFWTSFLFSEGAPNGAGQMVAYKQLP